MSIFQRNVVAKYLKSQSEDILERYKAYKAYFLNPEVQENIRTSKEEQFQEGFLRKLFAEILGYTVYPDPNFNLKTEFKNSTDSKKADGAIFLNGEPVGVIELKDHKTKDLRSVEAQAFGYKNNHKTARYVIISNFEKLRFYIDHTEEFEEFDLFNLSEEDFKRLYLILGYVNVEKGLPLTIKSESISSEKEITEKLYKDYSAFKRDLFNDILSKNEGVADKLTLFRKTQKLLDRLLFIFFAEDRGLIPPNVNLQIIAETVILQNLGKNDTLYDRYKTYFEWLDKGHKGPNFEICAYNGGLFKKDELLDSLKIDDNLLETHTRTLSDYNFESDVSVDILGHIFEHSLSEIEEIQNELNGVVTDKKVSKRKKDGVFYTPAYITKYIVENTIGSLCNNKKQEMKINLNEGEELRLADKTLRADVRKKHVDQLDAYREWLLGLTIVDPACGSGAFLNAAVQFLKEEHKAIDEAKASLYEKKDAIQIAFSDIETEILEKNIYGVDINDESVEIAKLSLWLHTAKPGRKLNNLNNNIKCGNSLISDPEVAGDKAFDWQKEFPDVFAKGGFDVVVGNPPYVDVKQMDSCLVDYMFTHYKTAENRINLYSLFVEKGLSIINDRGFFSFINPNSMLLNSSYKKLRKLLVDDVSFIVKLPDDVFKDASVETIVWGLQRNNKSSAVKTIVYNKDECISYIDSCRENETSRDYWRNDESFAFNIFSNPKSTSLLKKIEKDTVLLKDVAEFSLGITPYDKYKGHSKDLIDSRAFHSDVAIDSSYKPLIAGENVVRYYVSPKPTEYIKYGPWLGAPREERFFTEPRIIVRQIVSGKPPRIYAGFSSDPLYFPQIGFGIIPYPGFSVYYVLAILNSLLMNYYHGHKYLDLEKELFQKILIANCKQFPIKRISAKEQEIFESMAKTMFSLNSSLQQKRNAFIHRLKENFKLLKITASLAKFDKMDFENIVLELKKQKIKLSLMQQDEWEEYFDVYKSECNELSQKIASTDREIDQKVYELYDLTDEEIAIVEESTKVS